MAYEYLDHPTLGPRIHFRHADPDDDPALYLKPAKLDEMHIAWAYLDATTVAEYEALNSLGLQLQTDHPPYDPHPPAGMKGWYRFMDDLETLSLKAGGMVIIIDGASDLFTDSRSWVFELIAVWVIQLRGWQKRNAPCHLIFQMDADPAVADIYSKRH